MSGGYNVIWSGGGQQYEATGVLVKNVYYEYDPVGVTVDKGNLTVSNSFQGFVNGGNVSTNILLDSYISGGNVKANIAYDPQIGGGTLTISGTLHGIGMGGGTVTIPSLVSKAGDDGYSFGGGSFSIAGAWSVTPGAGPDVEGSAVVTAGGATTITSGVITVGVDNGGGDLTLKRGLTITGASSSTSYFGSGLIDGTGYNPAEGGSVTVAGPTSEDLNTGISGSGIIIDGTSAQATFDGAVSLGESAFGDAQHVGLDRRRKAVAHWLAGGAEPIGCHRRCDNAG